MRIPVIRGLIRRRVLVNYRADPAVVRRLLPVPFSPQLVQGHALVGVCLIRLEHVRPRGLPALIGLASENAAHRFAVEWNDAAGQTCQGVYVNRRDTDSRLNHLAGGRLFPGEHHLAAFDVADRGNAIEIAMRSDDGAVAVQLSGETHDAWPTTSVFGSLATASAFYERGSLGYSATCDPGRFDGLVLNTHRWHVTPLRMHDVKSSYFSDPAVFPPGSVAFDHALLAREIDHEWIGTDDLRA
ncbi:MAG: hypothetical protein DWQ37_12390 [Planctomycetota bacterium]|nr:MAG: hypothetical protein DWQ37_12390 [Planctomycetota bacterium]